jgi:predicted DNA-binding transcriptional regulator YafY
LEKVLGEFHALSSRPQLNRLVKLDGLIRRGRYPNAHSAARELEVSPRTVKRDISLLRDSWGAPLEFSREHNGYFYQEPDAPLPLVRLTEGELVAFYLCARLLPNLRGTIYERALQRALEKFSLALPEEMSVDPARLAESLSVAPGAVTPRDLKIFETLADAIRERRRLAIDYYTASRDVLSRDRLIDPYHLRLSNDLWYLFAYCHRRQRVLPFAVHRIRRVRATRQTFERAENFDIDRYLAGSFRTWRGDGHYRVVLRFPRTVAARAAEKTWHPSQTTELEPGGSLRMRFELSDLHEVLRWVLSWGADCEVLEPAELRAMIADEMKRMSALYVRKKSVVRSP